MRQKLQVIFILAIFGALLSSCRDNNTGVPLVAVDREVNITLPSFSNISIIGGWAYISGGSQGILIYRKTNQEFMVYDRHATHEINDNCMVYVDSSSSIQCLDPCSGSTYSMFDGLVTNGPAVLPLKQYRTSFDGTILRIYN